MARNRTQEPSVSQSLRRGGCFFGTFSPSRRQIRSTNPIERLNLEVKRRTNVVEIFPNEAAIVRLVGALLLEQNDEWAVCRRYMSLETLARLSDDAEVRPTAIPAA